MNPDDFVLQVLIDKLAEVNKEIDDTDQWRLQVEAELAQCEDDYNTKILNKNDILMKLKLIDPEGVYE